MLARTMTYPLFMTLLLLVGCSETQQPTSAPASRTVSPFSKDTAPAEISSTVEQLLRAHDFDRLEGMERELRDPEVRLLGGVSQIEFYYAGLAGYGGRMIYGYSSSVAFDAKRQLLEQWLQSKPSSAAAHVALAQFWEHYAQEARGEDYANEVTPEQWRRVAEGHEKAISYLRDSDVRSDPISYMVELEIAESSPGGRVPLDELYDAAIRAYPRYFSFYSHRARMLLERWYGHPGELQAFTESLFKSPGGDNGMVAYSFVTWELLLDDGATVAVSAEDGLSWPLIQAAYAVRERLFGLRNRDWNALFKLATAVGDRPTAQALLVKLAGQWDRAVWDDQADFDGAVTWTTAQCVHRLVLANCGG